jgi:hypothetical protein
VAKITHIESGLIPPDRPVQPTAQPLAKQKTVVVTPEPKTRKQSRANNKAVQTERARQQQVSNAHVPRQLTKSQKRAQRRRECEARYRAVQEDLATGAITKEEAQKRLPTRHLPDRKEA